MQLEAAVAVAAIPSVELTATAAVAAAVAELAGELAAASGERRVTAASCDATTQDAADASSAVTWRAPNIGD